MSTLRLLVHIRQWLEFFHHAVYLHLRQDVRRMKPYVLDRRVQLIAFDYANVWTRKIDLFEFTMFGKDDDQKRWEIDRHVAPELLNVGSVLLDRIVESPASAAW